VQEYGVGHSNSSRGISVSGCSFASVLLLFSSL